MNFLTTPEILKNIREQKYISEQLDKKLKTFFDNFTEKFLSAR